MFTGPMREILERFDAGYSLIVARNGQTATEAAPTLEKLQSTIDKCRADGVDIMEIRPNRLTLEEAFVRIAMGGRS